MSVPAAVTTNLVGSKDKHVYGDILNRLRHIRHEDGDADKGGKRCERG